MKLINVGLLKRQMRSPTGLRADCEACDVFYNERGPACIDCVEKNIVDYIPTIDAADAIRVRGNCDKVVQFSDVVATPVVHARWGLVEVAPGVKQYCCSACKDSEFWQKRFCQGNESYCPNCGARMDLEEPND